MLMPISARTLIVPCMVLAMVKKSIFMLVQTPNEQNTGGETDQLDERLDGGELADAAGEEEAPASRLESARHQPEARATRRSWREELVKRRAGWPADQLARRRALNAMALFLRRRLERLCRRGWRRGVIILRVLVVIVLRQ